MSGETDKLDAAALGIAARVLADQSEIDVPPTRGNIAIFAKQASDIISSYLEASQSLQSAREQGRIAGMGSERLRIIGIVSEYVDGATMEAILPAIRSASQSTTPKE